MTSSAESTFSKQLVINSPQGATPQAEIVADILASINEWRA